MIGQVQTKDGQKIAVPISGSIPTGNPVGTLLTTYKKIQPRNYLYCDGSTFNASQYPALYLYLGTNVLPDYRECAMVGAEENTTDQIAVHDVYAQGEFKDDQNKVHHHKIYGRTDGGASSISNTYPVSTHGIIAHATSNLNYAETTSAGGSTNNIIGDEGGDVARGKRKAVYVYIKAVDGVDIADEDTFLVTVKNFVEEKNSYSTTEMLTGGKWIDGKPIYRKVIEITETFVSSSGGFTLGIPITETPNIERVLNTTLIGRRETSQQRLMMSCGDAVVAPSESKIWFHSTADNYVSKVIVEYTKTTD